MGFMDEFKRIKHPYSDDEQEDYEDDSFVEEEPSPVQNAAYDAGPVRSASRVVSMAQTQVVVFKPTSYEGSVTDIAAQFRAKRVVVLNLDETEENVKRRLVDFLTGAAFVLDGKMQKTSHFTYIMTPHNVEISGDLLERVEGAAKYE